MHYSDHELKLTLGESLFITRRRAGMNQSEMAARHFLSRGTYSRLERDFTTRAELSITVDAITDYEHCVIYRRRCKITQAAVAKDLGVSRCWVNRMERGEVECHDLLWYWEQ